MKRLIVAAFIAGFRAVFAQAPARTAAPSPQAPGTSRHRHRLYRMRQSFGPAEQTALVKQYCTGCHNDRAKAGQLSLAAFDASNAAIPSRSSPRKR
jgi:hypothetical protein